MSLNRILRCVFANNFKIVTDFKFKCVLFRHNNIICVSVKELYYLDVSYVLHGGVRWSSGRQFDFIEVRILEKFGNVTVE